MRKPPLLLAAPLAFALAAALGAGCTGVSSTSVAPAKPGIRVRAESVTQGRGCGKGAGQIYKYSAFLRYVGPADADGTVWNDFSLRTEERNQRLDVDCFADADFTDLLERQTFSVDVCASTWDEWARAHGMDPGADASADADAGVDADAASDAGLDAASDAGVDGGADAAIPDAGLPSACGLARLTTVCTATTEPNVFPIVAACGMLSSGADAAKDGGASDANPDAAPADGAVDAPTD